MNPQRVTFPSLWVADYLLRLPAQPQRLYLLLHGYQQSARSLYAKLEPRLPQDAAVLAPNGPYPMPERRDGGYRVGYSWYFYDNTRDEYFIDMEVGLQFVDHLIQKLGLADLPTTLIGFSQGGYLAPFAASRLKRSEQVIGIASRFLEEELPLQLPFRLDAVHGAEDDVVPIQESRSSHRFFLDAGTRGEFVSIPGAGHRATPEIIDAALELTQRK